MCTCFVAPLTIKSKKPFERTDTHCRWQCIKKLVSLTQHITTAHRYKLLSFRISTSYLDIPSWIGWPRMQYPRRKIQDTKKWSDSNQNKIWKEGSFLAGEIMVENLKANRFISLLTFIPTCKIPAPTPPPSPKISGQEQWLTGECVAYFSGLLAHSECSKWTPPRRGSQSAKQHWPPPAIPDTGDCRSLASLWDTLPSAWPTATAWSCETARSPGKKKKKPDDTSLLVAWSGVKLWCNPISPGCNTTS